MTAYRCAACIARGKTWEGGDPVCAFKREGGSFARDNWNCATVGMLRDLVYEGQELPAGVDYQYCDDMKYATVRVHEVELDDGPIGMAMWVAWYKSRGGTDAVVLLESDGAAWPAKEQEILAVIEHYTAKARELKRQREANQGVME
jgi:hypothetical protein